MSVQLQQLAILITAKNYNSVYVATKLIDFYKHIKHKDAINITLVIIIEEHVLIVEEHNRSLQIASFSC